tara:strand:- start:1608 stop:1859 length:252 start_codon:yes stop_codon:yes gene_type:complete
MIQNRKEINKGLEEIFQETFEDEEIVLTDDTTAEDIEEWDSLMQIRLLIKIEKQFNLRFNPIEIAELENIGQMIDLMMRLLSK